MGMERRGCVDQPYVMVNQRWEEPLHKAKPCYSANRWEPDESRDSCPVLGGRGGEILSRYSTLYFINVAYNSTSHRGATYILPSLPHASPLIS
jgi:hypothetical protein